MNATSLIKLMNAKAIFDSNHPKFAAFLNAVFSRKLEEGTVIEFTVTRPGEEPLNANIRLKASDLELLAELKELMK